MNTIIGMDQHNEDCCWWPSEQIGEIVIHSLTVQRSCVFIIV